MKKKILELLKTKFEGVSESILDRIAEKLAKTVTTEEQAATSVEGVTFQQVLEAYGDSRATEATRTAVSNYEKKHGLKDGRRLDTDDHDDDDDSGKDDVKTAIKNAVQEAIRPLADEINALKSEKTVDTRRKRIDSIVNNLPERYKKLYGRVPIKDLTDEEFDNLEKQVKEEADEILKEERTRNSGYKPPRAGVSGGTDTSHEGEASKEEVEGVMKKLNV